ncbi:MAG: PQQ-dependent sugar dehydrogenase [Cyclobacteriaceae bacterium]|nr:PQQ-dependent sugar dehydrogenase [Cyclobacteriaceae bacterium]
MRNSLAKFIVLIGATITLSRCENKIQLPRGDSDNGGLVTPVGFEVLVVADSVGSARHMAVNENGDIYVKLRGAKPGGIVALRDLNQDGKADSIVYLSHYDDQGNYGTAMRIHQGYLYFSTAGEVYRSKLIPGQLVPDGKVEMIVRDDYKNDKHGYEHIAKPIALDESGGLYVPFGSPGDVCQELNRVPGYPGEDPCSQLEEHGGIWKFDANKIGQTQKDGQRYATGIRSLVAMDWNKSDNALYVAVHGRDNLHATWPDKFTHWQSAVFPSEEFLRVEEGTNGGWPYYYYDQVKGKRVLNPEYGGDGLKEGKGTEFVTPLIGFPAHWAPNDLHFYTGNQFPDRYKNGAFIAFHGSTNRAPYPQAGYFVAFIPFENGKPTGTWEVFADGFVGENPIKDVSDAPYRPMAIASGPDGSLYLSETVKGKIWRVIFTGNKKNFGDSNLSAMEKRKELPHIRTPDEVSDNLDKGKVAGGGKIYEAYCAPCHQFNGKGDGVRFPPLAGANWVTGDKTKLINILLNGYEGSMDVNGITYVGTMPKHDFLTNSEIAEVLTYIRNNFGNKADSVMESEVNKLRERMEQAIIN